MQRTAAIALLAALVTIPVHVAAQELAVSAKPVLAVAADGPPRVTDVSSNSAAIDFTSSIPLACSVVYGTTTDFGRIATDLDMDGGAHTDHNPLLTGLEPDTDYFFRVQGTAADGTFYVGEIRQFRTAIATATTDMPKITVVAVSSNFGGAANNERWGVESALDGNPRTAWSSAGDGNEAYLEVALEGRKQVDEVSVWSRSMSDGTARIKAFTITTDDGQVFGPFDLADTDKAHDFAIDAVTSTLRFDVVESTGGNVGLIEFAVSTR